MFYNRATQRNPGCPVLLSVTPNAQYSIVKVQSSSKADVTGSTITSHNRGEDG
jgi:hypothetical protein